MSGACLQGKARCVLHLIVHDPCSLFTLQNSSCKHTQPVEFHSGHPSLTPTHVGTQKAKESISEGEARAKSGDRIQQTELQGSQLWNKTEQALECAADKLKCTNAV